jgi:hypothetical protein
MDLMLFLLSCLESTHDFLEFAAVFGLCFLTLLLFDGGFLLILVLVYFGKSECLRFFEWNAVDVWDCFGFFWIFTLIDGRIV